MLIRNYMNENEEKPNEFGTDPQESWKLVRRFFILDSISGVEEGMDPTKPKIVRFANNVILKVMMDKVIPEAIYRPFLIINY